MKNKIVDISKIAIVSAIYIALTIIFGELGYGPIQIRVSEALMFLVLVNKRYGYGLTLGVLIANFASIYGIYDVVFGTIATILTILSILLFDKIKLSFLGIFSGALINALLVGIESMLIAESLFYVSFISVFISECIILFLGYLFYKTISKNKTLTNVFKLGDNKNE